MAAGGSGVEFKVICTGLDQLKGKIDDFHLALGITVHAAVQKIANHVAERAVANAPIKTGALRAAMLPVNPGLVSRNVTALVVDTMVYALRMHEDFYNLGPISVQQPMTPEGGVGRKYIERVVHYWAATYANYIKQCILDIIGSGGTVKVSAGVRDIAPL